MNNAMINPIFAPKKEPDNGKESNILGPLGARNMKKRKSDSSQSLKIVFHCFCDVHKYLSDAVKTFLNRFYPS